MLESLLKSSCYCSMPIQLSLPPLHKCKVALKDSTYFFLPMLVMLNYTQTHTHTHIDTGREIFNWNSAKKKNQNKPRWLAVGSGYCANLDVF